MKFEVQKGKCATEWSCISVFSMASVICGAKLGESNCRSEIKKSYQVQHIFVQHRKIMIVDTN